MLIGRNLEKVLSGKKVLRDVEIHVAPGKLCALLGANGSSKSVLLRALLMTDPADSGSVEIDGQVYTFPSHGRFSPPWPLVTGVFQQLFLLPHLRIWDQLLLPWAKGTAREAASERARELCTELDVFDLVRRYPNELSLGQRQRCAIIRAILPQPKYLLLDEPTSALDIESMLKVTQLLNRIKEESVGILLITHFMGLVKNTADSVIFLDRGTVAERGTLEVIKNPQTEVVRRFVDLFGKC